MGERYFYFTQPDPEPGVTWAQPRTADELRAALDACGIRPDVPPQQATIRLHCSGVWASYAWVRAVQLARRASGRT